MQVASKVAPAKAAEISRDTHAASHHPRRDVYLRPPGVGLVASMFATRVFALECWEHRVRIRVLENACVLAAIDGIIPPSASCPAESFAFANTENLTSFIKPLAFPILDGIGTADERRVAEIRASYLESGFRNHLR